MATPAQAMAAARAAKVAELAEQAKQFTPAGYLPAPPVPRFISAAEEAARKLPPSMKAESIKNALIKGGAKPVELEYAGIDQFLSDRKGQKVPSADVLQHIEREGPLGQLGRVDQRPPSAAEADASLSRSRADGWDRISAEPIPRLANIRKPFDEDAAYPNTVYSYNTEQGKRGDTSGYREVLFADPKNPGRLRVAPPNPDLNGPQAEIRPHGNFTMLSAGGPVDAHASDYWIRYHSNPNEIAVQNIQSDIGQRISKEASERPSELRDLNQRLEELYALEDRYLALPDDDPDKADSLMELSQTISEAIDYGSDTFRGARGPDGRWRFSEYAPDPASPISRDDKWKDFLARQIVLEAAAQGKPITLPTAANATWAENMPTDAAAAFYERDFPGRIMKVLKEFDPRGGGGSTTFVPDSRVDRTLGSTPYTLHYGLTSDRRKAAITPDVSAEMRRLLNLGLQPYTPDRLNAPEYAAAMTRAQDDLWEAARSGGLTAAQIEDARNLGVLYGLLERSPARLKRGIPAPTPDLPRPGTHIEMTPVARRSILERGMPILSVPAAIAAGAASQEQPGMLDGLRNR